MNRAKRTPVNSSFPSSSMKQIKNQLAVMLLVGMVSGIQPEAYSQNSSSPAVAEQGSDTNKVVAITYPPLSVREGEGIQLPIPPKDHPRLYLTASYLPELRRKSQHPLLKACWEKITKAAAYKTDGYLLLTDKPNNNSTTVRDAIEANALLFVLNNDQKAGQFAVDAVLHYFETLKIDPAKPDVTRELGRAIVTGAIVYDWCYPLVSAKQRTILIGRMETIATTMEIEWPQLKGSSITGHTVEAQLSRDMLSLGIAVYNEKPVIYNRVAGRIFAEFSPARQFFYPAGYHHQGSAYGPYRLTYDLYSTFIFDRMGYANVFGKDLQKVPYYWIYSRRPDGQLLRDGDDFTEQVTPFGKWWSLSNSTTLFAGSYYKDPIVLNEAFKEKPIGQTSDFLFDFLFFDPTAVNTTTKSVLPLTRYFGQPFGAMIARTGWQDSIQSSDVVALMKIQAYNFSNHQHLDAGNFQLYYKGPLTVQSGIYQGTNGSYGGEHFKNYSQRSIAHNTLLVYDSTETFTWHEKKIINDGGQRYPNDADEAGTMSDLLNKGYETGEVLAHSFGPDTLKPDYSYLKGELAKAYSEKVKSFKRSFVFLNLTNSVVPAALIVFDKVSASSKYFKKSWLLHCVEEPRINGIHTTIARVGKGYNGQLINTTLLPKKNDLTINKIGGPGNEYSVMGKNFPQFMFKPAASSSDSAVWRISVSPKVAATDNTFLNVMQVMDNGVTPEPKLLPETVETNELIGTKVGDRFVFFSKTGEPIDKTFQVQISVNEPVKVLITDVKTGSWTVSCVGDPKSSPGILKNTEGVLYFKAKKGRFLITKNR